MMKKLIVLLCIIIINSCPEFTSAQNSGKTSNVLYQYGLTQSFLGGLFRGKLPVSQLKSHGNYGIAAPDLVNGELMMYKGSVYQTYASGVTALVPDTVKVPLAFVSFFKPDTAFTIPAVSSLADVYKQIDSHMHNPNGVYAVRITGSFINVKTRACYPVTTEPFPPIAQLFAEQKVFDMENVSGTMFGYKAPSYLAGIDLVGYHFHYLSNDLKSGGHVLNFQPKKVLVEIALMREVQIAIPDDKTFAGFTFKNPQ